MTSDSEETEVVEESTKEEEKKPVSNKNKKNKKNKKNTPEPAENIRVTLPYKPKGEMFAVAETFQGGSRLQLICEDGKRRMGRIPGKLRRRAKASAIHTVTVDFPTPPFPEAIAIIFFTFVKA